MSNPIPSSSSTSADTTIAGIADFVSAEDAATTVAEAEGSNRRGSVRSANSSAIASSSTTPSKKQRTTALTANNSSLPLSDVSNKNEGVYSDAASPAAASPTAAAAAAEEGENPMECIATTTTNSSSNNNNEDSNAADDYYSTNVLRDEDKIVPELDDNNAAEIKKPASYATQQELTDADNAMLFAMSKFTKTKVRLETVPRDTLSELPPMSDEEEQWYKDRPDYLRKRWKELPPEMQKKLKGRVNPHPPHPFIVTTTVVNDDGTTSEICVATATSLRGRGEWVRYMAGKDGEKKAYMGTRGKGDMDPKCLLYQIGGDSNLFCNIGPNKSVDYREMTITRVVDEDSTRFIQATEDAEENKELFKRMMEKIEEDRKNRSVPMYLIEPAEDCKKADNTLPEARAKAKRTNCLQSAIGWLWDKKTSDTIQRLKDEKKKKAYRHEDLFPPGETISKTNGYKVTLIESEAVFDRLEVSVVYDEDKYNMGKLPEALPKRVRADQPDDAREPGFYYAIYRNKTDVERGIEPMASGYGTGKSFLIGQSDCDEGLFPAMNKFSAEESIDARSAKYARHWKKGSTADDKVMKEAIKVSTWEKLSVNGWLYNEKARLWVHAIVVK
jgi:hypothetical protein